MLPTGNSPAQRKVPLDACASLPNWARSFCRSRNAFVLHVITIMVALLDGYATFAVTYCGAACFLRNKKIKLAVKKRSLIATAVTVVLCPLHDEWVSQVVRWNFGSHLLGLS
jgi:hypothetical protein